MRQSRFDMQTMFEEHESGKLVETYEAQINSQERTIKKLQKEIDNQAEFPPVQHLNTEVNNPGIENNEEPKIIPHHHLHYWSKFLT